MKNSYWWANPKYWVEDPKTGYASARKFAGYFSAVMLPYCALALTFWKMSLGDAVVVLSASMTCLGFYHWKTPSNGAGGTNTPPTP